MIINKRLFGSTAPSSIPQKPLLYDKGLLKVTVFAGIVIVFSMLLVGVMVYLFAEDEVVHKLKTKDLVYIAQSIASKIDGRIGRAEETSLVLAKDPEIEKWVQGGERDSQLGEYALKKLGMLAKDFDYSNSFIVSAVTNQYWTETGTILETMDRSNPGDAWFFNTLQSGKRIDTVIDYNDKRNDTFVFVNALMGDIHHPSAVVGLGLSMKGLSKDFESYKYGKNSNLWLLDRQGNIHLSDQFDHNGNNISSFLPGTVANQVLESIEQESQVFEYKDQHGEMHDLISYPIQSTDWRLVFQISRDESVSFLNKIKFNTMVSVLVSLISIVLLFLFISRKLANPFKRALELNLELEKQIASRTKELAYRNAKIMDSIDYAKRIQESILPSKQQLDEMLEDYFIIWKPRDIVGGDFYWSKKAGNGYFLAVGDCTGHGVPGAFMTMLTISILNQLAENATNYDPSLILSQLHRIIKQTLHQESKEGFTDDGLDLGLCYITGERLFYAGARCSLYVSSSEGLQRVEGSRKSIGYRRTPMDYAFLNREVELEQESTIYITTDGFLDQNGGPKGYSFGRSRFNQLISKCMYKPLPEQQIAFEEGLSQFMADEPQRDDITVLAFRPKI